MANRDCEVEAGKSEPAQEMGTRRDHEGMNKWGLIDDRFVTSRLGNEDSSIQLSLRGEMDFWSYGRQ